MRHGPADVGFPPPDGPWQPLEAESRLVGWARPAEAGAQDTRAAVETGERIARERRAYLLGRLDHKLRSAVLSLQESARVAAFGRPELLESVYDQAQEVARRAAAMAAVAVDPKEPARAVVLAAVLRPGLTASGEIPADAIVTAPEPVLVEAMVRCVDWMGGPGVRVSGDRTGSWWRVRVDAAPNRSPLPVPEMGELLVRLLVDVHLDGWLDARDPDAATIYLRAVDT
jgi:hypothetical protein